MSIPIIGLIMILFGCVALRSEPQVGYTFLLCSMLLNAAAAMIIPGLGSIAPGHLFLGFVGLIALRTPGICMAARQSFRFGAPGFWLLSLCIYAVLTAFFLPRLFAGQIDINALSTPENAIDYFKTPLRPTNGNVTQSVYLIGGVACFVLFYGFACQAKGLRFLATAFLIYGTANIVFALLDLATSAAGASWLLDFIRNANYVVFVDATVGNVRRIIGSFSEAAAFAYATIGIATFAMRLWLGGYHKTWAGLVAWISLALLLLSTSSTAYVALVPCVAVIVAGSVHRSLAGTSTRQDAILVVMAPLLLLSVVCFVLINPAIHTALNNYLNDVIFAKSLSSSGIERSRLNEEAMAAFSGSHGFGVGLGSVRPSSFVVAVLANLGVVGGSLYVAFFASIVFGLSKSPSNYENQVRAAARYGCLSILAAATVCGTLSDPGLAFFAFAAFASAPRIGVPNKALQTTDVVKTSPSLRSARVVPKANEALAAGGLIAEAAHH